MSVANVRRSSSPSAALPMQSACVSCGSQFRACASPSAVAACPPTAAVAAIRLLMSPVPRFSAPFLRPQPLLLAQSPPTSLSPASSTHVCSFSSPLTTSSHPLQLRTCLTSSSFSSKYCCLPAMLFKFPYQPLISQPKALSAIFFTALLLLSIITSPPSLASPRRLSSCGFWIPSSAHPLQVCNLQ